MENKEDMFNTFLEEESSAQEPIVEETVDIEEELDSDEDEDDEIESEDTTVDDDEIQNEEDEDDIVKEAITSKSEEKPDFKAFAEMRVKNKDLAEQKEKVSTELAKAEALAAKLGYKNVDEMLEAADKRELEKTAKEKNIPIEILERINKLEKENAAAQQDKINYIREQKEGALVNAIDSFIDKKSLTEPEIAETFNKLEADGFTYEGLMDLPLNSVLKLMETYQSPKANKQKEIAKKEKLKKEIPLTPDAKSGDVSKAEEDELFGYFSGQKRDF